MQLLTSVKLLLCAVSLLLFTLNCCVYLSLHRPRRMDKSHLPLINSGYDLKNELDLVDCNYVMPDEDNIEIKSSANTDLNVLQLNIRGLLNKQDRIKSILDIYNVDVALLCETWLTDRTERLLKLPEYKTYAINRKNKLGGGVCILANNNLRSRCRSDLKVETEFLEHCIIELKTDTRNVLVVSGYRPPNCNIRAFIKEYSKLITSLKKNKHHEIIIGMDHNLDLLKTDTHPQTNEFLETNLRKSLIPCISKPTRITHKTATLIDNIMTSPIIQSNQCPYILVEDLSDHMPILVKFKNQNKSMKGHKTIKSRKLDENAIKKIETDLNNIDWPGLLTDLDTNDSFNSFHNTLTDSIDRHAPEKTRKIGKRSIIRDPWITTGILRSLKQQKQLFREMLTTNTDVSTFRYKSYRNNLQKIIRNNKQNYLHNKCVEYKNNGRKLWQLINRVIGKETNKLNSIESLRIDNLISYDGEKITNTFNEFFASVGPNLAKKQECSAHDLNAYLQGLKLHSKSIFLTPTTKEEIMGLLKGLPNKTSSGYDNISNLLLKQLSQSIVAPLEIIFNKSIEEGTFPENMKKADIVPLHKSKDRQDCTNYRPISLLITLSKLLEKVMYSRVYRFLENTDQIFPSQYGFRTSHSCENAISELISTIIKGKEQGLYTLSLFLDLSKAFDSLEHTMMLKKLESYGIRGNALDWFRSYLSNRLIRTKCLIECSGKVEMSNYKPINFGAPQGSCLGPLLFLIFTNDLHQQLHHCSSILFADDTTLYKSHRNLIYLQWCIQDDMNRLMQYFRINKLTLNLNKTICVLFQKNKRETKMIQLSLGTRTLTNKPESKFLGVTLDQHLTWSSHLNNLTLKLNKNLNLLRLSRNMMTQENKLLVYRSHLESHIQYGILLWGNGASNIHLTKLQKIQDKALGYVTNKKVNAHEMKTMQVLNIASLIELSNLKFGYKALHNLLPPITTNLCMSDSMNKKLSKEHSYNTRHRATSYLPKNASQSYINSFLCKGPQSLISLNAEIKMKRSLNSFTKGCKTLLLNKM